MLQVWQPNTLPLPCGSGAPVEGKPPEVPVIPEPPPQQEIPADIDDNFPKGRIVKYFPHQGYGFILSRAGKEIYFNISEVDFVAGRTVESIHVGSIVGFDVSWTSHGLHVKRLKVY